MTNQTQSGRFCVEVLEQGAPQVTCLVDAVGALEVACESRGRPRHRIGAARPHWGDARSPLRAADAYSLQITEPGPTGVSTHNQAAKPMPYTVEVSDAHNEVAPGRRVFKGAAKGMRNVAVIVPAGGAWHMAVPADDGSFSVEADVPDVHGPMSVEDGARGAGGPAWISCYPRYREWRAEAPAGWYMIETVGSPSRARTCDNSINSRMLYQLSYRGSRRSDGGAYNKPHPIWEARFQLFLALGSDPSLRAVPAVAMRRAWGHALRPRGGVATQRTANPCTPVRFRARPPISTSSAIPLQRGDTRVGCERRAIVFDAQPGKFAQRLRAVSAEAYAPCLPLARPRLRERCA